MSLTTYNTEIYHLDVQDYQRHLTSQPTETDDFGLTVDLDKETFTSENARNADQSDTFRHEISGNILNMN